MKLQDQFHRFQEHQFRHSLDKYLNNAENQKARDKYKNLELFYKNVIFDQFQRQNDT